MRWWDAVEAWESKARSRGEEFRQIHAAQARVCILVAACSDREKYIQMLEWPEAKRRATLSDPLSRIDGLKHPILPLAFLGRQ
jgi:hypothetical protein